MKHALVIGGSGMLAKASIWLANQGYIVSVIGRDASKLEKLCDQHQHIVPVSVDYTDEAACKEAMEHSIASRGAYNLVVAWIHGGIASSEAMVRLLQRELTSAEGAKWQLFHVIGSRADAKQYAQLLHPITDCEYHQIQLGFVIENNGSRWLTNEEIADGVIECVRTKAVYHLVGTLMPESMRP